ncbi:MAG: DUF1622 domain-containing protein [Acidobacteria bacterium]|nr:DUF1622 domain-containing protein [Acidobacteriota bacterium]
MESIKLFTEWSATGIEVAAVVVIVIASLFGTVRFLIHVNQKVPDAFRQYKHRLGKMLILSLEFLVAADIIRTVALEPTLMNAAVLGLLVLIRTFLSWSLSVEIEGHWPWQSAQKTEEAEAIK